MSLKEFDFSNHMFTVEVPKPKKRIEPTSLGVYNGHNVFLYYGTYGYYLKYNNENYSIPNWAKYNLNHAIKIIDFKRET